MVNVFGYICTSQFPKGTSHILESWNIVRDLIVVVSVAMFVAAV